MRKTIYNLVSSIVPYDLKEGAHKVEALAWIQSGAELCRLVKPDIPPMHPVSYFVLLDQATQKILLVNHKKAGRWLPAGGHVEKDEHPSDTVTRELWRNSP